MAIRNAIATIAVTDLKIAAPWYEKLIGRGPDRVDAVGAREWVFEQGGRLQLCEQAARAGGGSLVLAVGDLEFEIQQLNNRGIAVGEVNRLPSERALTISDPDGNTIALAELADSHDSPATEPSLVSAAVDIRHSPQPLEQALESIAADSRLNPRDVRRFLDSIIEDLEALLRASDENMTASSDLGRAAQLLQRAHIVRGKLAAPPPSA